MIPPSHAGKAICPTLTVSASDQSTNELRLEEYGTTKLELQPYVFKFEMTQQDSASTNMNATALGGVAYRTFKPPLAANELRRRLRPCCLTIARALTRSAWEHAPHLKVA